MPRHQTFKGIDVHVRVNHRKWQAACRLADSQGLTFSALLRCHVRAVHEMTRPSTDATRGKQQRVHLRLDEEDRAAAEAHACRLRSTVADVFRAALEELAGIQYQKEGPVRNPGDPGLSAPIARPFTIVR